VWCVCVCVCVCVCCVLPPHATVLVKGSVTGWGELRVVAAGASDVCM